MLRAPATKWFSCLTGSFLRNGPVAQLNENREGQSLIQNLPFITYQICGFRSGRFLWYIEGAQQMPASDPVQ